MVGSVLSIVYQREDGTRNSVLDLGCPVTGDPNEGSSKSKLQSIDFKLVYHYFCITVEMVIFCNIPKAVKCIPMGGD